jgi:hypothetical protein
VCRRKENLTYVVKYGRIFNSLHSLNSEICDWLSYNGKLAQKLQYIWTAQVHAEPIHFSTWDYAGISHRAFCTALFVNQMHHRLLFATLSHLPTEKTVLHWDFYGHSPVACIVLIALYSTIHGLGSHTYLLPHCIDETRSWGKRELRYPRLPSSFLTTTIFTLQHTLACINQPKATVARNIYVLVSTKKFRVNRMGRMARIWLSMLENEEDDL